MTTLNAELVSVLNDAAIYAGQVLREYERARDQHSTILGESIHSGAYGQGWPGGAAHLQDIAATPFAGRGGIPQPLLRGVDDRPANWVDRVRACGNAVVPQIPELIGHAILQSREAA